MTRIKENLFRQVLNNIKNEAAKAEETASNMLKQSRETNKMLRQDKEQDAKKSAKVVKGPKS